MKHNEWWVGQIARRLNDLGWPADLARETAARFVAMSEDQRFAFIDLMSVACDRCGAEATILLTNGQQICDECAGLPEEAPVSLMELAGSAKEFMAMAGVQPEEANQCGQ